MCEIFWSTYDNPNPNPNRTYKEIRTQSKVIILGAIIVEYLGRLFFLLISLAVIQCSNIMIIIGQLCLCFTLVQFIMGEKVTDV